MSGTARRGYGSGSLWREQRKQGEVWIGQVCANGVQRQKTLGPARSRGARVGMTKAMAEGALREFRREVEEDAASDPAERARNTKLLRVAEEHLDYLESSDTKPSTIADYRGYLHRHVLPFFGDVELRSIRVRDVERFITFQRTKREQRVYDKSKKLKIGLSASTVSNQVNYLHAVFAFAQRREFADANPVSAAQKPKIRRPDSDFSFLTPAQLDAVIRAVADDYLGPTDRALILTAAMTGLRQGELIALRWRDILWTGSAITVRASVSRGVDGDPKSATSRREVPMGDRVATAVELHHQQSRYRADTDRVFCHPHTGRPYDPGKIRTRFYDAMRAAGLGHMIGRDRGGITFHSLRHTFGTQMASAGVPLIAVKDWMGHADIQTTMIYAKWGKDRAADRALVDAAFERDNVPSARLHSNRRQGSLEDRHIVGHVDQTHALGSSKSSNASGSNAASSATFQQCSNAFRTNQSDGRSTE